MLCLISESVHRAAVRHHTGGKFFRVAVLLLMLTLFLIPNLPWLTLDLQLRSTPLWSPPVGLLLMFPAPPLSLPHGTNQYITDLQTESSIEQKPVHGFAQVAHAWRILQIHQQHVAAAFPIVHILCDNLRLIWNVVHQAFCRGPFCGMHGNYELRLTVMKPTFIQNLTSLQHAWTLEIC